MAHPARAIARMEQTDLSTSSSCRTRVGFSHIARGASGTKVPDRPRVCKVGDLAASSGKSGSEQERLALRSITPSADSRVLAHRNGGPSP